MSMEKVEFEEVPEAKTEDALSKDFVERLKSIDAEEKRSADIKDKEQEIKEKRINEIYKEKVEGKDNKDDRDVWKSASSFKEGEQSIAGTAALIVDGLILSTLKAQPVTPEEAAEVQKAGHLIDEKYHLKEKVGIELYFLGVNAKIIMRGDRITDMQKELADRKKRREGADANATHDN